MFGGFSMGHLLVVLVIVLLVFGTKRLKTLGGDLGSAIKGFKNALSDDKSSDANKDAEVVASEPKRVVTEEKDPFNNTTTANTTEPVKSTVANSDPK